MKGKIGFDKRMGRYYVSWYHGGRTHKIWYYNGWKLRAKEEAEELLSVMRGDDRRGMFRIERYLKQKSEVGPVIDKWLKVVISKRAPATQAVYKSVMDNHVRPFFDDRRISLAEIDYGLLMELNAKLPLSETSKKMLFRVLKSFMQYCQKINRIDALPIFPSRDDFSPELKAPVWIPEHRQVRIIEAIDPDHQPIYWWLKFHMRRPAEACALMKHDFDGDEFTVRRTFSNSVLHETTKHKHITHVPCVEAFKPIYEGMRKSEGYLSSQFFFVNPQARTAGKHYTVEGLRNRWKTACKRVGENIQFYSGTKHSSASQLLNEFGLTEHEVRMALDCSVNTVKSYARAEVKVRKAILDRAFSPKLRKAE